MRLSRTVGLELVAYLLFLLLPAVSGSFVLSDGDQNETKTAEEPADVPAFHDETIGRNDLDDPKRRGGKGFVDAEKSLPGRQIQDRDERSTAVWIPGQPLPVSHRDVVSFNNYLRFCPRCMVRWESLALCPLDEVGLQITSQLKELQEMLSLGCRMGYMQRECNDKSRCCLDRERTVVEYLQDLSTRIKETNRVLQFACDRCPEPPEDCGWSEWSSWSACSVTCGMGTRLRTRSPNNPPARNGGRECEGPREERVTCHGDRRFCCVDGAWGLWGAWSTCHVTCGKGLVERRRACDSPPPDYCGRPCPGDKLATRETQCGPEPLHGMWSSWGSWSACSAGTCGTGTRERSRTCNNPRPNPCGCQCPGPGREVIQCGRQVPVNGNWGDWGAWSECSMTTCLRQRERCCDSPTPACGGLPCPGPDIETASCEGLRDGQWSFWSPWSRCSVTCGPGTRDRSRTCSNPPPDACGKPCAGSSLDMDTCNERPCCRDGQWSFWSPWSRCSVTCGPGTRDRSRTCSSPPPNACGRPCVGVSRDTDTCNERPCCRDGQWSFWSSWSGCSVTCGPGTRDRSRTCSNPAPDVCGRSCVGLSRDTDTCNERPCCRDGHWSPWASWSPCSVTCGPGERERSRACNNPPPNECGRPCAGSTLDRGTCEEEPYCPKFAKWELWCPCDCRKGETSRRRRCYAGSKEVRSSDCQGVAREAVYCDVRYSICPGCITDCTGRKDGTYPACNNCSTRIICQNNQAQVVTCPFMGEEWDDFNKTCVFGDSPSCSLATCVSSCEGMHGKHPDCSSCSTFWNCQNGQGWLDRCPQGLEFDFHRKNCSTPPSPTCQRRLGVGLSPNWPVPVFDPVLADQPSARFITKDTSNETPKHSPRRPVKPGKRENMQTTSTTADTDSEKSAKGRRHKPVMTSECHVTCTGLKAGYHASCRSCSHYLLCTKYGRRVEMRCRGNKHWDDARKKCRKRSSTCKMRVISSGESENKSSAVKPKILAMNARNP